MIIPNCSVMKGNVVKVVKNRFAKINIKFTEVISKMKEYEILYITDINGIEEGKSQIDFIKKHSLKKQLWVDGGVRYSENTVDVLIAGAENVVIGTKTLVSIEELKNAFELSENIVVQIDYKNGIVSNDLEVIAIGVKKFAEKCREIGIQKIIFADYDAIEKGSANFELVNDLLSCIAELYVVANKRLSYDLEKIGVKGVVVDFMELTNF